VTLEICNSSDSEALCCRYQDLVISWCSDIRYRLAMATSTLDTAALIEQFQSIGLSKPKATEAVKSPKSATVLKDLIQKNHLASRSLGDKQASLVLTYAIHLAKPPAEIRETAKETIVVDGIVEGQLKSVDQVNG
jgi:glutaminyl-tRNA synthetase